LYINDWALAVSTDILRDKALWLAQTPAPIGDVVEDLARWLEENSMPLKEYERIHKMYK